MSVIGITGSLCSGKSTVLKMFKAKGVCVFDADKRVHQYYADKNNPVYKKVTAAFSQTLVRGKICRKRLGEIVFSDKNELKKLEKIVHPEITKELLKWVKKAKNKRGIYAAEVPLLFEKKLGRYFDRVVLVTAKREVLVKRVTEKYNFSATQALKRLALYISVKKKKKMADYTVDNSLEINSLKKEVSLLWKKIKLI